MSTKVIDMTEGTPYKKIWRFAFPLIIGNILQQMYVMADSLVLGNSGENGTKYLAALGASGNIIFLFVAFFTGFSVGATIVVAQYIGAKKPEMVQKTVDTIYRTLFILSVPIIVLGIFAARPLMQALHTPEEIIDFATIYLQINLVGIFALYGFNINNGIMQGMGDSKSPLLFLSVGMGINIVLDLIFVLVFEWGVAGAATATVIAECAAFAFSCIYISRKKPIKIKLLKNEYDSKIMKTTVKLGLPAGMQNLLFSMGLLFLQNLINIQGDEFIAGYNVGNKIDQMTVMILVSFSAALTAYVGQNFGANNLHRVKKGVRQTLVMAGSVVLVLTGLVMMFSRPIIMLFDTNPNVILAGQAFIYGVMPFYVVLCTLFLVNSSLRSVNHAMIPLIGACFSIIVRVITAYWLTDRFGAQYMFVSYGLGWCFSFLINMPVYLFGKWRKKPVPVI